MLALLAAALALVPGIPAVVSVVFAAALLLVLPGLALVEARRPRTGPAAERLVFAIALSVAIAVVGGVLVNWTPLALDAPTWVAVLAGVTVVAGTIAIVRNRGASLSIPSPGGRHVVARLVLAALALGVTGGALALARTPLPAKSVHGYTALWILPAKGGAPAAQLGVESAELEPTDYLLEVRESGRVVSTRSIALGPGEQFRARIPILSVKHPPAVVEAILFKRGSPTAYRRVRLVAPAPADPAGGRRSP